MSKSKTKYEVVFQSNKVEKQWLALESEFPDRMAQCKSFLTSSPTDRRQADNKLKKLQGKFKGILQYDVTKDDARVWYRVDKKVQQVIVKYAGHHPNW
jgi:mRNA-degrading endonuclease RelE of RelBE toxin-antitoxin system